MLGLLILLINSIAAEEKVEAESKGNEKLWTAGEVREVEGGILCDSQVEEGDHVDGKDCEIRVCKKSTIFRGQEGGVQQGVEREERGEKLAGQACSYTLLSLSPMLCRHAVVSTLARRCYHFSCHRYGSFIAIAVKRIVTIIKSRS